MGGGSLGVFIGLTVILAGGASILAGQAIADNWRPAWQVVGAAFGLALFNRFLVYALFNGRLLDAGAFVVEFLVILAFGLIAYRLTAVRKMVSQYPWRYEQSSPWSYREKLPS
jgi:hypothetical protein